MQECYKDKRLDFCFLWQVHILIKPMYNFFLKLSFQRKQKDFLLKKLCLSAVFVCISFWAFAQGSPEIGLFGGLSTYNGDMSPQRLYLRQSHAALGVLFRAPVYKGLGVRVGVTLGDISGNDRDAKDSSLMLRNLNFGSSIVDFHVAAEYDFFDIDRVGFTPYVFAGLALYHFNPYSHDTSGQKVYLQPLSTEGQGLSAYPDRSPYKLTQFAIPFGAGVKFAITDVLNLGVEFSMRKTFTDYLDDVSKTYVDENTLLAERGQTAVDFAYRTNKLPGHEKDMYPPDGTIRGSGKYDDWYYFAGVTLTYRLDGGRGNGLFGNALRAVRCPFGKK